MKVSIAKDPQAGPPELPANLQILQMLEVFFRKYPHARFFQGLVSMGVIQYNTPTDETLTCKDGYYEPSSTTLERVVKEAESLL